MSEVLMSGGSGGIDSSDVTANKADVLEGKSTITSDSDDEVVAGTMPLLTSNSDLLNVMLAYQRTDQFGMGKFIDSPGLGRGLIVALRPEDSRKYAIDNRTAFVFIPLNDLKAENIRADKNIGQVQGNIPVVGQTGIAQGQVILANGYVFFHNIPVGIYESQGESWAPEAAAPVDKVRAGLGIQAHKIAADETIAGLQGTLPVWNAAISGYSDMLYSWGNQGHAIDHPRAGRGVVVRVPNNFVIRNANWVYLAEPDLIGPNIRQGVNMFGIQGEMVDYGAGRAAFYNATFDGTLLSGVANADREVNMGVVYAQGNMAFNSNNFANRVNNADFRFLGIADGGLRFSVKAHGDTSNPLTSVAAFFAHSVNLAPFRRIKIGGKFLNGSYRKRANINDLSYARFGLVAVSKKNVSKQITSERYKFIVDHANDYKGVHVSFHDGAQDEQGVEHGRLTGQQLWAEIDVSGVNEQCYLFVYANGTSFYPMTAEMVINHIEFIN